MVYAIIWFIVIVGIYILSYILNKRTKKPEGCKEIEACSNCTNVLCGNRKEGESA